MIWIVAHPWMTFFLAVLALLAANGIVKSICHAVIETCHALERMNTLNLYNKPCREDDTHEN